MKAFIVYPTFKVQGNNAFIQLYGRLENGESFVSINEYKPYFFVKTEDAEKARELVNFEIEDTEFLNIEHKKVSKVIVNVPRDIPEVKRAFSNENVVSYEADVKFEMRYLIDKGIHSAIDIEGKFEKGTPENGFSVDRVYTEPAIGPTDYTPTNLKVLSFDIETDPKAEKIFCISIYTEEYKKVIIATKKKDLKHAEIVEDEHQILERFVQIVKKIDPDIITGWNMIDFDFKVIIEKMNAYHVQPQLCRDRSNARLRLETQFHLDSKADFVGRQLLDGIQLFKTSFIKLDDYKLNTAAKEILGDTKLLEGESRFNEIERLYKEDQQRLIDYNLKDSKLVFDLL